MLAVLVLAVMPPMPVSPVLAAPPLDGGSDSGGATDFTVVDLGNGSQTRATWADTSRSETGFELLRQKKKGKHWDSGVTTMIPVNTTTYVDTPGQGTFRYKLRTLLADGVSISSAFVVVTVGEGGSPPPAPDSLQASDAGNRRAILAWNDRSAGAAAFQLERNPAFSSGTVNVSPGVTGYVDQCGAGTFAYRVRATNAYGNSAFTGWVSVNIADIPPAAPSGLTAADLGNQSQVRVSWVDNSDNETSFKVERDTQQSNGTWSTTQVLSSGANTTSLTDTVGQGAFRYRVSAANSAGSSAWTAYVTISISGGWTVFVPSADTRKIYVSSSSGNDANNGLSESTPRRTIASGYSLLRNGYPDWLLLRAGDVWTEVMPTWNKSGRGQTEMMLVSSYSSAARPKIQTGNTTAMSTPTSALNYLAFVGLNFIAHTWTGSSAGGPTGPFFVCTGGHWVIEDCLFERYANNLIIQGWPRIDDVKLRRNIFWNPMRTDTGNTNIYIDNVDRLVVEENLFVNLKSNDSLTNGAGTKLSHNAYLHESCGPLTVIGNIAYNGRTNFSCRPGGVVRDNLSIRGGQGFQVGWDTYRASTVTRNVCTESRNHWNGQPLGQGFVLAMNSGTVVSENIVSNSTDGLDHYTFWFESSNKGMEVKNNISHNWWQPSWEAPLYFFNGAAVGPISIHHNDMQQSNSKMCVQFLNTVGSWVSFDSNRYYTQRTGYCGDSSTEWTFNQWKSMKEPTAVLQQGAYPDAARTVGSYHASLGGAPTTEAFLIEAKNNSKANWRAAYTAQGVNAYIRAGFGVGGQ